MKRTHGGAKPLTTSAIGPKHDCCSFAQMVLSEISEFRKRSVDTKNVNEHVITLLKLDLWVKEIWLVYAVYKIWKLHVIEYLASSFA